MPFYKWVKWGGGDKENIALILLHLRDYKGICIGKIFKQNFHLVLAISEDLSWSWNDRPNFVRKDERIIFIQVSTLNAALQKG